MEKEIAVLDGGRIIRCSDGFARLLGLSSGPIGSSLDELVDFPMPGVAALSNAMALAEREGVAWLAAYPPGGISLDVNLFAMPSEGVSRFLVLVADLTPWKLLERDYERCSDTLNTYEELLSLAGERAGAAFWEFQPGTLELRWLGIRGRNSPSATDPIALVSIRDQLAQQYGFIRNGRDQSEIHQVAEISFDTQLPGDHEGSRWIKVTGLLTDDRRKTADAKVYGIAVDIQGQRVAEQFVDQFLKRDITTNLPSEKILWDAMQRGFQAARSEHKSVAVLVLHNYCFRQIGRIFGRKVATAVLLDFVARLRSAVRSGDGLYQIGEDDFAILLTGLERDAQTAYRDASSVAIRLLEQVSDHYAHGEQRFWLQGYIGLACFPSDGEDPWLLVRRAQGSAHFVRHAGRQGVVSYWPTLMETERKELEMDEALREGIRAGQFELHYQPQTIDGTTISGAEALLRWRHPSRGLLSAAEFIEIAERTGAILDIGPWVIEEGCRQLADWRTRGFLEGELELAINISAVQFCDPRLVSTLNAAISRHRVAPGSIVLEITESAMLRCDDQTEAMIRSLVDSGIKIAIDDFGMGYSSLRQLKRLPIHQIKIDREFVVDATEESGGLAIIKAIMSIAEAFRLQVIAEGVESDLDARRLREVGCRRQQGFYYGKPVLAATFCERYLVREG